MSGISDLDEGRKPRRRRVAGPAADAATLAEASARLAQRRQRDALPLRLDTARLTLRAPIRGDVPDLVRNADNRNVARWLSRLPSPYTRADGIGFVEIIAQRPDERPYAIVLDDHLVGIMGISFAPGQLPELGYWLGEAHWGKGIATEAGRALVDAAFATGQFPRLRARAIARNAGSLRVLEKLGFVRTGDTIGACGGVADQSIVLLEAEAPRWR
jgi:RimJ/RimL family protein N-acetyltransferase